MYNIQQHILKHRPHTDRFPVSITHSSVSAPSRRRCNVNESQPFGSGTLLYFVFAYPRGSISHDNKKKSLSKYIIVLIILLFIVFNLV